MENKVISIECMECGAWEEMSADMPRHKSQTFDWIENHDDNTADYMCNGCGVVVTSTVSTEFIEWYNEQPEERYILVNIKVMDGDREHVHKNLITTKCKNLKFAAELCTARYWGYSYRDGELWWYGEFAGKLESFKEVSKEDYEVLSKYI